MEPTIFDPRLKFKPRLKFFKFSLSSEIVLVHTVEVLIVLNNNQELIKSYLIIRSITQYSANKVT